MKRKFCEYCGELLENKCDCLYELSLYEEELIDELENRPETQLGWRQQDLIDMRRREC